MVPVTLTYEIDPVRRLITLVVAGEVTEHDIRTTDRALLSEPGYDRDFDHLVDGREGRRLIGSADVLRELAARPSVNAGVRRALVAGNLLTYGLARLFQAAHDAHGLPDEVRIFRSIEDARAWLATPRVTDRRSA